MPKKSVRAHGTQAGQQSNTEKYKSIASYKTLSIKDDSVNEYLKSIYDTNIWNLKDKFEALASYYDEIGISNTISCCYSHSPFISKCYISTNGIRDI